MNEKIDKDSLDIMFNLVDYPTTKAEIMALTKYNTSINCVF